MAWGVVAAFVFVAIAAGMWRARSRRPKEVSDAQSQVLRDLMNVAYCHKVLLATPHCGELARLVAEMRREALSLSRDSTTAGASPAVYGDASVKQTDAGLNLLCTVNEKDSVFHYHYSISMPEFTPGFHLTAPQGQTLALFIGRAMGCSFDQMHVQASAASVFHVEWDIPAPHHAEWLAQTSAVTIDDVTVDRMRDECFEARHRMQWQDVPAVKDLIQVQANPDATDREWFYSPDGENRVGPVSLDDLRALVAAGKIEGTTPLWRQGLETWMPAGVIDGLVDRSGI